MLTWDLDRVNMVGKSAGGSSPAGRFAGVDK